MVYWSTYILKCADGTYYCGVAKDPKKRVIKYNSGRGARYTSVRRPVILVYSEKCKTYKLAIQREKQIKGWRKKKKENLIKYGKPV